MDVAFFNVVSECKILTLTNSTTFEKLKHSLNIWGKEMMKIKYDAYIISAFKNIHYEQLSKVYFTLKEVKNDNEIRSFLDRYFTTILDMKSKVPRATLIFEEFIQGITYFKRHDDASQPVYHRLMSCGNGSDSFRRLHQQCQEIMTRSGRNDIKTRIMTCYIERLIYDELFKEYSLKFNTEVVEQDNGHKHRLELTNQDFKTCFPNINIEIVLEYDQHLPIKITIIKHLHNMISSIETYEKSIRFDDFQQKRYSSDVVCFKETNGKNNIKYMKIQGFIQEMPWKKY